MEVYQVRLAVTVSDPQALWRKAKAYMRGIGLTAEATIALLGTEKRPKVEACLAMLLDRGENLDGAEIDHHEIEVVVI